VSQANAATHFSLVTSNSLSSIDVQVDHFIEIRNGGLVLINDTVKLSAKGENTSLISNFLIGFPFEYGKKDQATKERFNPEFCLAFEENSQERELRVLPDVGLGRLGFYGANVIFDQAINISSGHSYSFKVVFVFSNLLQAGTVSTDRVQWNMTYPLYPSIVQDASCVVKVFLPENATLETSGENFTITTIGSRQILNLTKSLTSFEYETTWLTFTEPKTFLMLEANKMTREIALDQLGRIFCSETYTLRNKGAIALATLKIRVPQDIYDVSVQDKTGVNLSFNATVPTIMTISFPTNISKNAESTFTVTYQLPWKNYVNQYGWRDYSLTFAFFEQQNFDWIIRDLTTSIILPEGADFTQLPTLQDSLRSKAHSSLQKNAFQETLTFNFYNVTPSNDLNFNLSYGYVVFWASFRPTLWMGTIVFIICAVAFLWRIQKPPAVPITPFPSKDLRNFVKAYEEKTGILSELISMEQQLQKGKIPRRKYKVRRKTLEGRLSLLSRDLTGLKEKLRRAGARYTNIIGQIEVNETELETLEMDIKRVESRYRRGEISKGAYQRLLEEYHRRRERARVTIDGVLLRLKEEIG